MKRREDLKRIFRLAKEWHNESDDWEPYNPDEEVMYTLIFGTEKQARFLIKALEDLGCECHNENECDEKKTMWTVITPYEIF